MKNFETKSVDVSASTIHDVVAAGVLYAFGEVNDDLDIPYMTIIPSKNGYTITYTTKKRREVTKIGA